ncbi:uncharacterized protein [Labrus bergylta]|uniref:uncharacterized protein n=1 Tax=Labrus bergylta TaxID=56723 RepID=UPI003314451E
MDELRRSGRSAEDMSKQLTEALHLKYKRAHLAYLQSIPNIRDAEAGVHGQRTITVLLRPTDTPAPFGGYSDPDGWCGVSISAHYLVDCVVSEYQQEQLLTLLLQGTFEQALRSDHTCKVARKVVLSSGTMSSYATMNGNWMILSWVLLQSECDRSLHPMYEGLSHCYTAAGVEKVKFQWVDRDCFAAFKVLDSKAQEHLLWDSWRTTEATSGNLVNTCASRSKFNKDITIKLDLCHCMQHLTRECVSEHYSSCTAPFSSSCLQHFLLWTRVTYNSSRTRTTSVGSLLLIPPREHCRTKMPQSRELLQRVEDVMYHFHLAKDTNDVQLFKASMLKEWRIQRVHILRGCLSDPEVGEGILYRYGGTLQLNYTKGQGAAVPVWIPVRGTSQQEGFHFHQAQWVTGNRVSSELFQAQAMTGVVRWNFQRLVDLKLPGVELPAVFDPLLLAQLNTASVHVTGKAKYPAMQVSNRDTGERFGLQYVEPGCRPIFLYTGGVEKIVTEIMEKQQQQQKQKKMTRNCLACGQPKSRYLGDGSSIHFFYQTPIVKYFYCSTKVFKTYEHEGLKNPRMSFEDFAATPFFEQELDAAKQRGAEWRKVVEERAKRISTVQLPTGCLCRFCHQPLKQGPSSPHIHTSFPGVLGKYIYCPSRVFSLYRAQGMVKEMTWVEFQQSGFYDTERDRWVTENKK